MVGTDAVHKPPGTAHPVPVASIRAGLCIRHSGSKERPWTISNGGSSAVAQAIGEYLGDGLGGPVALFVAGIILLMVALLSVRLKQRVEVSAERQR